MPTAKPSAPEQQTDAHVSDLNLLYTFEGAARASAAAWASAAAQADDPQLRRRLADMVAPSLRVQEEARALIRKLGGNI